MIPKLSPLLKATDTAELCTKRGVVSTLEKVFPQVHEVRHRLIYPTDAGLTTKV
jgi:hypothetical protein